jgi:hypothetical protein
VRLNSRQIYRSHLIIIELEKKKKETEKRGRISGVERAYLCAIRRRKSAKRFEITHSKKSTKILVALRSGRSFVAGTRGCLFDSIFLHGEVGELGVRFFLECLRNSSSLYQRELSIVYGLIKHNLSLCSKASENSHECIYSIDKFNNTRMAIHLMQTRNQRKFFPTFK